ncbi:REP-associated tyrosine transposase [Marinimicrobium alkaliphilum]|uniref:REP-associated tyrosine transposase n=1 Tax=Marinimicrobium alkaliphilum TaxID=2202654 RepID=UPI000DB97BFC|nr:transposase [Marinimicrobium alkaliphilum]
MEYRRYRHPGASYFFTLVTRDRQPVLTTEPVRTLLREALASVRVDRPFHIDAMVLLPDHLHTIWTLPEGDSNFATRWRLIKSHVVKAYGQALWQKRYWEHFLRDDLDYRRHVDYVHFNPVKHGMVKAVADWPFSSFHRWVGEGVYPVDWGGRVPDLVGVGRE